MKTDTGKTKYILLGLLAHEPMNGYGIKRAIEVQFSHFWQESFGQIYPALKKLEDQGLIHIESDTPISKRPNKVYRITESGKSELAKWLEEKPSEDKLRSEMLVKISFGYGTTPETVMSHIHTFKETVQDKLDAMNSYLDFFATDRAQGLQHGDHTYTEISALFGRHYYEALVKWAEEAESIIENRKEAL